MTFRTLPITWVSVFHVSELPTIAWAGIRTRTSSRQWLTGFASCRHSCTSLANRKALNRDGIFQLCSQAKRTMTCCGQCLPQNSGVLRIHRLPFLTVQTIPMLTATFQKLRHRNYARIVASEQQRLLLFLSCFLCSLRVLLWFLALLRSLKSRAASWTLPTLIQPAGFRP